MSKKENRNQLTDEEGDVRELLLEDFREAVPFSELPPSLQSKLTSIQKLGRPHAESPKEMIAFRLSPDVLAGIKALGRGYNARVEKVLREALEQGRL